MSELHLPHSHESQKIEDLLPQLSNTRDFEIAADIFKQLRRMCSQYLCYSGYDKSCCLTPSQTIEVQWPYRQQAKW